jgi:hypothetical protein
MPLAQDRDDQQLDRVAFADDDAFDILDDAGGELLCGQHVVSGAGTDDIAINNLRGSAQLFENRLCGGSSLPVGPLSPASHHTLANGAELELNTSHGVFRRDVRATSGYLLGDPARIHFGFRNDAALRHLDIRWPDGSASRVDEWTPDTVSKVMR